MGVRGLMSHCLRPNNNCVEIVDLVEISRQRGGIEILVDFFSFEHMFMTGVWTGLSRLTGNDYLRVLGGEYLSIDRYICSFIQSLKLLDIHLVFVIDGSKGSSKEATEQKMETWKMRHHSDVGKLFQTMDVCRGAKRITDLSMDVSVRPVLLEVQVISSLKQCGCEIIQCSSGEADGELAKLLIDRDKAYAILSNDSDFCIFRNCRFIPTQMFDTEHDLQLGEPSRELAEPIRLRAGIITNEKVMASFGFTCHSQLVDMSIMVGNDFTNKLMMNMPRNLDYVTQWLKENKTIEKQKELSEKMRRGGDFSSAIQHSREFYFVMESSRNQMNTQNPVSVIIQDGIEGGDYPATFMGIQNSFYWHRMLMEDVSYGHPCIEWLLADLRSRIYRMILPSQTSVVVEYGRTPLQEFKSDAVYVSENRNLPNVQFINKDSIFKNLRSFHFVATHQEPGFQIKYFDRYGRKNGFICYLLRYFLVLNWRRNLMISENEFLALVALVFGRPKESYQEMAIRPSPRCVTIGNWFQDIYRHFYLYLGHILYLKHEFPAPKEIFAGAAWVAFYSCSNDDSWFYAAQQVPDGRLYDARREMNHVLSEKKHMLKYLTDGMFDS